jgi:F-type H+-transporting ATPase subunit b
MFATVLAQAEEEAEGIDLLLPDSSELIAGVIAFLIIFAVVWKYALPTLSKTLEARQEAIVGQIRDAEETKAQAESLLADYKTQVEGAQGEANEIIEEARVTAESMRTDIVSRADAEAASLLDRARSDVAIEKDRAAAALRQDVANLSLDMAEKVVAGSLDRDAQAALVDHYLDELDGLSS